MGTPRPSRRKVAAWAAATGVRVEWLLGEEPAPAEAPTIPAPRWRKRRGILASPANHNIPAIPAPRVVDLRERIPA